MQSRCLTIATIALLGAADAAHAQRRAVSVDAFAGGSSYGRFLEQTSLGFPQSTEIELRGSRGLAVGGSIGFEAHDATGLRLGGTYTSSEFEYRNDTAGDGDSEFGEQLGFSTLTASAEIVKYVGNARWRVRPYGLAGVAGTWWSLDDGGTLPSGAVQATGESTLFRFGGIGGVGLRIRATDALALRLEVGRVESGSPFNGSDAWRSSAGRTMDEPDRVGVTRLIAGVSWTLGGKQCCVRRPKRGRR